MNITTAIIGVSGFGHIHYNRLMELRLGGRACLAAAAIINQNQEEEKCRKLRDIGCALYDDYRAMLDDWRGRLDLCIIPTGIHYHSTMTQYALRAGANVLVEKPAAGVVQEVDAMIDAETKSGRFVAVGFQHLYTPEIAGMKRAILNGLIGEVEAVKCVGLWPRFDSYYERNNWAGRLKCSKHWVLDAPFNNAFAHWLNLLCFMAGSDVNQSAPPLSVQAELYRSRQIQSTDTACMRIETDAGIPLMLWLTHSCPNNIEPILEVRGTLGSLVWTQSEVLHRNSEGTTQFSSVCVQSQSHDLMLQAILDKIQGIPSQICGLDIARQQTLCANGAFESSTIHQIDPQFLSTKQNQSDSITIIEDIEETCQLGFEGEHLWSEMNIPWARPGKLLHLDNYCLFQGKSLDRVSASHELSIPSF